MDIKWKMIDDTIVVEGDYTKDKRALVQAQYRLLAAFLGVLVIVTLYGYIFVEIASANGAFIPQTPISHTPINMEDCALN